jgi:hypothetical protein
MKDTCGSCLHWRLNIQPAAYQGTCMHFLDTTGRHLQMRANDFCSRYIEVEVCHKEPVTCTCDSCITERTKVCGSCKYLTFILVSKTLFCTNPNSGWKVHGGRTISCSRWEAKDKEPTAATYVLMTLLTRQLAELQSKVQDLGLKIDIHIIDENRHLRRSI